MTERYLIRTFGCQMNEHDSERLAGLLEAEGLEPAAGSSPSASSSPASRSESCSFIWHPNVRIR